MQARREAEKQASTETRRQEELRSYKQVMQVSANSQPAEFIQQFGLQQAVIVSAMAAI